jgi:hypothetical protein
LLQKKELSAEKEMALKSKFASRLALTMLSSALLLSSGCGSAFPSGVEAFPKTGSTYVNPDTRLILSFKSGMPAQGDGKACIGKKGKIRIFDAATGDIVDSLDLGIPAGPTEKRDYATDIDYAKIPYDYSRSSMPTNRDTKPGTPSGTAEPTPPDYQLNIIGGFTDAFHFRPVILHGDSAIIYLHNNMLDYGHRYYVTIDGGVLNFPGSGFEGIKSKRAWSFRTKKTAPARHNSEGGIDTLAVNANGSGDFSTLQGALDFIPDFTPGRTVILVAEGDYEELIYTRNKQNVTIIGAGMGKTRFHYSNNEVFNPHPLTVKNNERPGTFPYRRAAFALDNCRDITLKDMTIATDLKGQAEGLLINGERIALYRVHIIGDGDALQANGTIYMESCELDGGWDAFLGRGSLFAYRCALRNQGGPFSWVRNTEGIHGDVFVECSFEAFRREADTGKSGESLPQGIGTSSYPSAPATFGRTGKVAEKYPFSEFVVIDCRLKGISPAGWEPDEPRASTSIMYEFNSRDLDTDRPVDISRRRPGVRQLELPRDSALIQAYRSPDYILKGWNPDE